MTGRWVVLEPLDTVAIRDGRAFDAGQQSVAQMTLPSPATFAGAVGAAYDPTPGLGRIDPAARSTRLPAQIHGPIVVRRNARRWHAQFPVPRDVVVATDGAVHRLAADRQFTGVAHDIENDVGTLLSEPVPDTVPADGKWWDAGQLRDYLHDGAVSEHWLDEPWRVERRVGLARGDDRTVTESMFYSIEHIRPEAGVGFSGRCTGGPDRPLEGTVAFGGQGRRAELHADIDPVELPGAPDDFPDGTLLLYLVTPAVFPGGIWRPSLSALSRWGEADLVCAAVGPPQVISTSTANRRSGAVGAGLLMWAVPAGSVYYLRFHNAAAAKAAAENVHETTLTQADDWMTTAGFGLVLTGRWTDE